MTDTVLSFRPQLRVFQDAEDLGRTCDETLREATARSEILHTLPPEEFLGGWDDLEILVDDVFGPVSLLSEVDPDPDLRKMADEKLVELTRLTTALFQNDDLFRAVTAVEPATPAEKKLKQDLIEEFEDNGVHLPSEQRERVGVIMTEISELSQEFSRNIRENDEKVAFSREDLDGLPEHIVDRLETEGESFLVALDYPEYNPFMMNVHSFDARRRLFMAYNVRGGQRNLEILGSVNQMRGELAEIYGLTSFAELIVRRRMARTSERVFQMLSSVMDSVDQRQRSDLEALVEEKRSVTGEEGATVERWDTPYLLERIRSRRFEIDQESLRGYFPTEPVTRWILQLCGSLYGIGFDEVERDVWHDDVRVYDITESDSGEFVGSVYLDLFPREGKYKHAAAWPVRGVSRRVGRTPISVLVTNFDRRGLTQNEVETYLHEFGHVLHGVLSSTWFNRHAGTSVERDFVEAPSQMFEWWARRMESLTLLTEVSPESPAIDENLARRLEAARRFGRGIHYARQHLYASYDMALAVDGRVDVHEKWKEMEANTPLGYVDETIFPASFAHLTGGYAAGYYGYLWSEAIAVDLLSAFGQDLMDPRVGKRFRDEILSRGSEVRGEEMVESFLGRRSNSDAFARDIRGNEGTD